MWPSSPNRVAQSGLVETRSSSLPGSAVTVHVSSDCHRLHPDRGTPSMPGLNATPSLRRARYYPSIVLSIVSSIVSTYSRFIVYTCLSYGEILLHAFPCIRDIAPFFSLSSFVLAWSHWSDLLTTAWIIFVLMTTIVSIV